MHMSRSQVCTRIITARAERNSYLLVLVSAFTLFGLNRLPPKQVFIEEDTLGFDWGKGPKSYPEKCPVAADFLQTHWQSDPSQPGCRNRHLLDFHQSPFSRVAVQIPLGARPILLGGALPGIEVPDGIALAQPVGTALSRWNSALHGYWVSSKRRKWCSLIKTAITWVKFGLLNWN